MSETRPRREAYRLRSGLWRVPCKTPGCEHMATAKRRNHGCAGGSGVLCQRCRQERDSMRERAKAEARLEAAGKRPLRNPADDRSLTVFDASIRGVTDQFIVKLRKP